MGGWGCTTGPSGPDRAPIAPSGPDQAPIAPSGPDQGCLIKLQGGILSKIGGEVGPGAFRKDSGRVWCC